MTELSKSLMCVLMRSGVEVWMEEAKAQKLIGILNNPDCPRFIDYGGEKLNVADISGVFRASTMEEKTRRKNGEWKCSAGEWHERFEKCSHSKSFEEKYNIRLI